MANTQVRRTQRERPRAISRLPQLRADIEKRRAKTIAELQRMTLRQLRQEAYFQQFEQNHKAPDSYPWPLMEPWKYIAKGFDPEPKSERERAILAICQRLVREERSFETTPVHSFICAVLERMCIDHPNVPNVKQYLKQMEAGWDAVLASYRKSKRRQKEYEDEYGFWAVDPEKEECDGDETDE